MKYPLNIQLYLNVAMVLFLAAIFSSSAVRAGGAILGATEITQIANNVELIGQVQAQIETYQTLYRELQLMIDNNQLLSGAGTGFDGAQLDLFADLYRALQRDSHVGYAADSLLEEYQHQYPDYADHLQSNYGISDGGQYAFRRWDQQNKQNTLAALETVNINADEVLTEGQMIDKLQRQAQSTTSQKAIMQLANDLSLTQLGQARRMENLMQTQIVMQANYAAADQTREAEAAARAAADAELDELFLQSVIEAREQARSSGGTKY